MRCLLIAPSAQFATSATKFDLISGEPVQRIEERANCRFNLSKASAALLHIPVERLDVLPQLRGSRFADPLIMFQRLGIEMIVPVQLVDQLSLGLLKFCEPHLDFSVFLVERIEVHAWLRDVLAGEKDLRLPAGNAQMNIRHA